MRGSVSKSGNPCAKLTALSGPFSARLSRVISRMTDSVKLCALSERTAEFSVPGIGSLQVEGGAGAGEATRGTLETALPPAAHVAGPACLGEEVEHVRATQQSGHLAASDHGHAADALADEKARRLVDACFFGDRDDARAHDVARGLAFLGEDVSLGDDADHVAFRGDDRRTSD